MHTHVRKRDDLGWARGSDDLVGEDQIRGRQTRDSACARKSYRLRTSSRIVRNGYRAVNRAIRCRGEGHRYRATGSGCDNAPTRIRRGIRSARSNARNSQLGGSGVGQSNRLSRTRRVAELGAEGETGWRERDLRDCCVRRLAIDGDKSQPDPEEDRNAKGIDKEFPEPTGYDSGLSRKTAHQFLQLNLK